MITVLRAPVRTVHHMRHDVSDCEIVSTERLDMASDKIDEILTDSHQLKGVILMKETQLDSGSYCYLCEIDRFDEVK